MDRREGRHGQATGIMSNYNHLVVTISVWECWSHSLQQAQSELAILGENTGGGRDDLKILDAISLTQAALDFLKTVAEENSRIQKVPVSFIFLRIVFYFLKML